MAGSPRRPDPGPDPEGDLGALEERLGYRFENRELLERAITHRSAAHERGEGDLGNERLEFLGDAVLDLVVSEQLMQTDSAADEGTLSRARAAKVNTQALAERAMSLELGVALRLGRGEARQGGQTKPSILANVFEAVVAAVYLDGGLDAARALVHRVFPGLATGGEVWALRDPKTRLQERLQAAGQELPSYEIAAEWGPDHAREFEAVVKLAGRVLGSGAGRSKRDAEQAAALRALEALGKEE